MSEQVKIQKTIYSLQSFNNVINTNFTQLIRTTPITIDAESVEENIKDFFELYNSLFYEIPPSGSDDSHLGIATRSLEYLGVSLEDLTTEISTLREENIELKNQLLLITNTDIGTQI